MPKKKVTKKETNTETPVKKKGGGRKKYGGLNANEIKILQSLNDNGDSTRNDLKKDTGIQKGYSGLLGSPTKTIKETSLEGRKMVKSEKRDTEGEGDEKVVGGYYYKLTATGKKVLEKANKEKAAADAEE